MNTKNIPALIMLLAGFIAAMTMIIKGRTTKDYLITLILVLVIFYIIGLIVKFILDKFIKMEDPNKQPEEKIETSESLEDIPIVEGETMEEGFETSDEEENLNIREE
ncbi:MAG: hypothetical protein K6G40_07165 [Eubacterium sp.]|nr:hypothetical protein [Eubacterium sp.]